VCYNSRRLETIPSPKPRNFEICAAKRANILLENGGNQKNEFSFSGSMAKIERICPECGTSNSYTQASCMKCRAPLTPTNTAQTPTPLLSRRGLAKLAWRATKSLTRAGFHFARRRAENGIERLRQRNFHNVKNELIEGEYEVPPPRAANDWRVWSSSPESQAQDEKERLHWGTKNNR
jgi:hypothetical protein